MEIESFNEPTPVYEKGFDTEEEELDSIKNEAVKKATEYFGSVEETEKYAGLDGSFFMGTNTPEAQKVKAMNEEENIGVKENYAKLLMKVINGTEQAKSGKNEPSRPSELPHDILIKNIKKYATEIDNPQWIEKMGPKE